MEFLLNRYRNLTVLLVVIAAQLLLLAYQVKSNQDVRLVRVWAVTAVTPLARILEVVRRNTIGIAEDYFDLIHVRDENNRIKKELGSLKMENQFLKTELSTADRAQALSAFQSRTQSRTIAARIIGNGTGMNSKDVLIDRGSGSGVMRGMAVVTPDGIVGRVLVSYPTASQVLLITDPTFAAGVISEKNRVHGTLKGIGQSKVIIDYVQNEEKVDVGEVFYTSGDDRVFPKGLPVGTATVVRPGKIFKDIFVVPAGTQNGLEEVLVVVEGIHQAIPDAQAVASTDMYILPAPPADKASNAPTTDQPGGNLTTDADRLRERYKKIGAAQGHVFGQGLPGARPANFNLDPDEVKPPPVRPPGADAPGQPVITTGAQGASGNANPVQKTPDAGGAVSGVPRPLAATPGAPLVRPAEASGQTAPRTGTANPVMIRAPGASVAGEKPLQIATRPQTATPGVPSVKPAGASGQSAPRTGTANPVTTRAPGASVSGEKPLQIAPRPQTAIPGAPLVQPAGASGQSAPRTGTANPVTTRAPGASVAGANGASGVVKPPASKPLQTVPRPQTATPGPSSVKPAGASGQSAPRTGTANPATTRAPDTGIAGAKSTPDASKPPAAKPLQSAPRPQAANPGAALAKPPAASGPMNVPAKTVVPKVVKPAAPSEDLAGRPLGTAPSRLRLGNGAGAQNQTASEANRTPPNL